MFSTNTRFFSLIFWETGPSMRKYRLRSTFCSGRWSILIPEKNLKNRDLKISKISNIDEVDIIYIACPRGLSGGKTEPPDYILMFCSANVPGITYKINFRDVGPPLKKSESSTKYTRGHLRNLWKSEKWKGLFSWRKHGRGILHNTLPREIQVRQPAGPSGGCSSQIGGKCEENPKWINKLAHWQMQYHLLK